LTSKTLQKAIAPNKIWLATELIVLPITLCYFLFYPRDPISDFLVCSCLCFCIIAFSKQINLHKPKTQSFSTLDFFLAISSISIFIGAWAYGFAHNKVNLNTASTSILITVVYFYYAWIQHFLAQRYTAIRLRKLVEANLRFPNVSMDTQAALLTGLVFGILHIPYPNLMMPAAIGGAGYAYYFLNSGRLWAVVVSHSLIASSWIYWGLDSNAFDEFIIW